MPQVDVICFLPLLFWFIISFIIFYFTIFSYVLPVLYTSLKVRILLFELLNSELIINVFRFKILLKLISISLINSFHKCFVICSKRFIRLQICYKNSINL